MDYVTNFKNNYRAEHWEELIRECQESGQTVVSWCSEHEINIKTYYYWLRKLRLASLNQTDSLPCTLNSDTEAVVFKKLKVVTPIPNNKAAVVIRMNGATVEVNEGASRQTVQAVLLALQSLC